MKRWRIFAADTTGAVEEVIKPSIQHSFEATMFEAAWFQLRDRALRFNRVFTVVEVGA